MTIKSFADHNAEIATLVWQYLDASQIIDSTTPSTSSPSSLSSSSLASLGTYRYAPASPYTDVDYSSLPADSMRGLMHDLFVVEARQRSFPLTLAFVELILALYCATPPPTTTPSTSDGNRDSSGSDVGGLGPYLSFIRDNIFLRLDGFQFESPAQRYRLSEACLALFSMVLHDFNAQDFNFAPPKPVLGMRDDEELENKEAGDSNDGDDNFEMQETRRNEISGNVAEDTSSTESAAADLMLHLLGDSPLLHCVVTTLTRSHEQLRAANPTDRYISLDGGDIGSSLIGSNLDSQLDESKIGQGSKDGAKGASSSTSAKRSNDSLLNLSRADKEIVELLHHELATVTVGPGAIAAREQAVAAAAAMIGDGDNFTSSDGVQGSSSISPYSIYSNASLAVASALSPTDAWAKEQKPSRELIESNICFALRLLSTALSFEQIFVSKVRESRVRLRASMLSDLIVRGRGSFLTSLCRLIAYDMTVTSTTLTRTQRHLLTSELKIRLDEELFSRCDRNPFAADVAALQVAGVSIDVTPSHETFNQLFAFGIERLVPDPNEVSLYACAILRHLIKNVRKPSLLMSWMGETSASAIVSTSVASLLRTVSHPFRPRHDPAFNDIVRTAMPSAPEFSEARPGSPLAARLQQEGERVALIVLSPVASSEGALLCPHDYANRNRIAIVQMLTEGLDAAEPALAHVILGFDTSSAPSWISVQCTDLAGSSLSSTGSTLDAILSLSSHPQFAKTFPVLGANVLRLVYRLASTQATSKPFLAYLHRRSPLYIPCMFARLPANLWEAATIAAADMPVHGAVAPVRVAVLQALIEQRAWALKIMSLALHLASSKSTASPYASTHTSTYTNGRGGVVVAYSSMAVEAMMYMLTSIGLYTTKESRAAAASEEAAQSGMNADEYNLVDNVSYSDIDRTDGSGSGSSSGSGSGSSGIGSLLSVAGADNAQQVQRDIIAAWTKAGYSAKPRRRLREILEVLHVELPTAHAFKDPLAAYILRDALNGAPGTSNMSMSTPLNSTSQMPHAVRLALMQEQSAAAQALSIQDKEIMSGIIEAYAGWDRLLGVGLLRCVTNSQEIFGSALGFEVDSGPLTKQYMRQQLLELLGAIVSKCSSSDPVWTHLIEQLGVSSLTVSSTLREAEHPVDLTQPLPLSETSTCTQILHLFEQLVAGLVNCRLQIGRARLYVAFSNLIHYVSVDASRGLTMSSTSAGDESNSRAVQASIAAPELYRSVVQLLCGASDRLVKVATVDAADGQETIRTLALSFLSSLAAFAPSGLWAEHADTHGLVSSVLSDGVLTDKSEERAQLMKIAIVSPSLRQYAVILCFEAATGMLATLATSDEGADVLLRHNVVRRLAAFPPLSHRPLGRTAIDLAPGVAGPYPLQRYQQVLSSALQLIIALAIRAPRGHVELDSSMLKFFDAHETALLTILKDEHQVVFNSTLSLLELVLSFFYQLLTGPSYLSSTNPLSVSPKLIALEQYLLRLVVRYSNPQQVPQLNALIQATSSAILSGSAAATNVSNELLPLATLLEDAPLGSRAVDSCGNILRLSLSCCVIATLFRQKRARAEELVAKDAEREREQALADTYGDDGDIKDDRYSNYPNKPITTTSRLLFTPYLPTTSSSSSTSPSFGFSGTSSTSLNASMGYTVDLSLLVSIIRDAAARNLACITTRNTAQACLQRVHAQYMERGAGGLDSIGNSDRDVPIRRDTIVRFAKEAMSGEPDLYMHVLWTAGETPASLGLSAFGVGSSSNNEHLASLAARRLDPAVTAANTVAALSAVRSLAQTRLRCMFSVMEQAAFLLYHHVALLLQGTDGDSTDGEFKSAPSSATSSTIPFLTPEAKDELAATLSNELAGGQRGRSIHRDRFSSSQSASSQGLVDDASTAPLTLMYKVLHSVQPGSQVDLSVKGMGVTGDKGVWALVERGLDFPVGFSDIGSERDVYAESVDGAGYALSATGANKAPLALLFAVRLLRRLHLLLSTPYSKGSATVRR